MLNNTDKLYYSEAYTFLENSTKIEIDSSGNVSDDDYSKKEYLNRLLKDIQGNIIKSHGRTYSVYLFIRFELGEDRNKSTDRQKNVKNWIGNFADKYAISAIEQQAQTQEYKESIANNKTPPNKLFINFSLSFKGYEALGLDAEKKFEKVRQQKINNSEANFRSSHSFKLGMLGTLDSPPENQENWEHEYLQGNKQDIHALILLADSNPDYLWEETNKIIDSIRSNNDIVIAKYENGLSRKIQINDRLQSVEPFGFQDGISQPLFLKSDIDEVKDTDKWDPSANLRLVLNIDPFGNRFDEDTSDAYSFGSFLVYQKLEQDVTAFNNKVSTLARVLADRGADEQPKEETEQFVRAAIVGRFREDGRPMAEYGTLSRPEANEIELNNFNYEPDFSDRSRWRCPFHAHIRKVNPRAINSHVYDGENYDDSPQNQRNRRIVRRSASYGVPEEKHTSFLSASTQENLEHYKALSEKLSEKLGIKLDRGKEGTLFLCFQSDIKPQFEKLRDYSNSKDFGPDPHGNMGADPISGQKNTAEWPGQTWPRQWGVSDNPVEDFDFSEVVTPRGGEYFFTPSLSFLKSLTEV